MRRPLQRARILRRTDDQPTLPARVKRILRKYGASLRMPGPSGILQYGFLPANYRESTGQILAAVDQQVGLVVDAAQSLGPECAIYAHERWVVNNGVYTKTSLAWGGVGGSDLTVGKTYRMSFTVTAITAGSSLGIYRRNASNTDNELVATISIAVGGSYSVVVPMVTNLGTYDIWVDNNTFAGTLTNFSVRELPGIHAAQSTSGFQPYLRRGPVNLWTQSHDAANVAWVKFGGCIVSPGIADPSGGNNAQKVTRTIAGPSYLSRAYIKEALAQPFTLAAVVKRDNCRYASLRWQGAYPNKADGIFDLQTGSVHSAAVSGVFTDPAGTIFPLGNGFYLCAISATSNAVAGTTSMLGFSQNAQQVDGTDAVNDASCVVYGVGLFRGAITAEQISLYGGIPVSTTAPASSINGVLSWQFDGEDDRIVDTSVPFQTTDEYFRICAVSKNPDATLRRAWQIQDGSGELAVWLANGACTFAATGAAYITAAFPGDLAVVTARRSAAGLRSLRVDGVFSGSSSSVVTPFVATASVIGNRLAGDRQYSGPFYCDIAGKGAITDAELLVLEKFAAKLQGRSL